MTKLQCSPILKQTDRGCCHIGGHLVYHSLDKSGHIQTWAIVIYKQFIYET